MTHANVVQAFGACFQVNDLEVLQFCSTMLHTCTQHGRHSLNFDLNQYFCYENPMPNFDGLPKTLIMIGLAITLIGGLLAIPQAKELISKLGSLPGDIKVEKENFKMYFPLTTSLLISAILSLLMYIFRKPQ